MKALRSLSQSEIDGHRRTPVKQPAGLAYIDLKISPKSQPYPFHAQRQEQHTHADRRKRYQSGGTPQGKPKPSQSSEVDISTPSPARNTWFAAAG